MPFEVIVQKLTIKLRHDKFRAFICLYMFLIIVTGETTTSDCVKQHFYRIFIFQWYRSIALHQNAAVLQLLIDSPRMFVERICTHIQSRANKG